MIFFFVLHQIEEISKYSVGEDLINEYKPSLNKKGRDKYVFWMTEMGKKWKYNNLNET